MAAPLLIASSILAQSPVLSPGFFSDSPHARIIPYAESLQPQQRPPVGYIGGGASFNAAGWMDSFVFYTTHLGFSRAEVERLTRFSSLPAVNRGVLAQAQFQPTVQELKSPAFSGDMSVSGLELCGPGTRFDAAAAQCVLDVSAANLASPQAIARDAVVSALQLDGKCDRSNLQSWPVDEANAMACYDFVPLCGANTTWAPREYNWHFPSYAATHSPPSVLDFPSARCIPQDAAPVGRRLAMQLDSDFVILRPIDVLGLSGLVYTRVAQHCSWCYNALDQMLYGSTAMEEHMGMAFLTLMDADDKDYDSPTGRYWDTTRLMAAVRGYRDTHFQRHPKTCTRLLYAIPLWRSSRARDTLLQWGTNYNYPNYYQVFAAHTQWMSWGIYEYGGAFWPWRQSNKVVAERVRDPALRAEFESLGEPSGSYYRFHDWNEMEAMQCQSPMGARVEAAAAGRTAPRLTNKQLKLEYQHGGCCSKTAPSWSRTSATLRARATTPATPRAPPWRPPPVRRRSAAPPRRSASRTRSTTPIRRRPASWRPRACTSSRRSGRATPPSSAPSRRTAASSSATRRRGDVRAHRERLVCRRRAPRRARQRARRRHVHGRPLLLVPRRAGGVAPRDRGAAGAARRSSATCVDHPTFMSHLHLGGRPRRRPRRAPGTTRPGCRTTGTRTPAPGTRPASPGSTWSPSRGISGRGCRRRLRHGRVLRGVRAVPVRQRRFPRCARATGRRDLDVDRRVLGHLRLVRGQPRLVRLCERERGRGHERPGQRDGRGFEACCASYAAHLAGSSRRLHAYPDLRASNAASLRRRELEGGAVYGTCAYFREHPEQCSQTPVDLLNMQSATSACCACGRRDARRGARDQAPGGRPRRGQERRAGPHPPDAGHGRGVPVHHERERRRRRVGEQRRLPRRRRHVVAQPDRRGGRRRLRPAQPQVQQRRVRRDLPRRDDRASGLGAGDYTLHHQAGAAADEGALGHSWLFDMSSSTLLASHGDDDYSGAHYEGAVGHIPFSLAAGADPPSARSDACAATETSLRFTPPATTPTPRSRCRCSRARRTSR